MNVYHWRNEHVLCKSILIEDEFHVLMKGPLYDDLRYPLFLEASFLYNDFDQMTEQDLFYVCLFYAPKPVIIFLKYVNGFYMVNSCHVYIHIYIYIYIFFFN